VVSRPFDPEDGLTYVYRLETFANRKRRIFAYERISDRSVEKIAK
jgi:hypothetical protein